MLDEIKIVSGGQTGVDQAALRAAKNLGIPYGGWCPKGRIAENGIIPEEYKLQETATSDYRERTILNITDSDGTLILVPKELSKISDGTLLTIQEVQARKKPYLLIDLSQQPNYQAAIDWIKANNIKTLNVAGPRESQSPGIHEQSFAWLETLFRLLKAPKHGANTNYFKPKL